MDQDESDFLCLKILVEEAKNDFSNIGNYLLKAYWLGQGKSVDVVLAKSLLKKPNLTLVKN